jgi:hypothetical protein
MRYEAHISAYDVMDMVTIGCTLRCQQSVAEGSPVVVLAIGTDLRGEGITDPREWLKDALIGLLEAL